MRPRTPTLIWIPFVFSVGTISWALLAAGLVMLAAVVVTPAVRDLRQVERNRNDYQATLDLLNQKIAMQKEFMDEATRDPVLMQRLASRQLNLNRPDQEVLPLDPGAAYRDRSVETLLAESLTPTEPKAVTPLPKPLLVAMDTRVRPAIVMAACIALALSFFLGVKYERS